MRNNLIRVFVNQAKVFEISKFSSIFSLKKKIVKSVYNSYDLNKFILTHNGQVLVDNQTVVSYNIENNSNVRLDYKINGGNATNIATLENIMLIIYFIIILPSFLFFFITGVPSVVSSIITTYFKKKQSPVISFIIQSMQVILLFWFIVILITCIVLIPYYFISKSNCYMFKNASNTGWTAGIIYILFFMIYYFFNIVDLKALFKIIMPEYLADKIQEWVSIDSLVGNMKCIYDSSKTIIPKLFIPNYGTYTSMLYDPIYKTYDVANLIKLANVNTVDIKKQQEHVQIYANYLGGTLPWSDRMNEITSRLNIDKTIGGNPDRLSICDERNPTNLADGLNISEVAQNIANKLSQSQRKKLIGDLYSLRDNLGSQKEGLNSDQSDFYKKYEKIINVVNILAKPAGFLVNNIPAKDLYSFLELGPVLAIPVLLFILIKIIYDTVIYFIWG